MEKDTHEVTRRQIFADKFPTIKSIIEDPIFSGKAITFAKSLVESREKRPKPEFGKKYKRDWVDSLLESNEPILKAIADVWARQSSLSSDVRQNLEGLANRMLQEAIEHYYREATKDEPMKVVR